MGKPSKIFDAIKLAVTNGKLKQPFSVAEVNSACNNILSKSPSFLSKHSVDNPGKYKVYFKRDSTGKYSI